MAPVPTLRPLIAASLVLVAAACGGGDDAPSGPDAAPPIDAAVAPAFSNRLPDRADSEIAVQALQLIGGEVEGADRNCNACHGMTRGRLREWADLSTGSLSDCLTDLAVTDADAAHTMAECLRSNPAEGDSPFTPEKLGFWATAAHLEWFDYLFDLGYGAAGNDAHAEFSGRVLMPRGAHAPFTQEEFDVVAEWVFRGLPLLDELIPEVPGSGDCTQMITADVGTHVDAMATGGWHKVNEAANINMYGCAGAATTRDCMADQTDASTTTYGAGWASALDGTVIRILRVNDFSSSYWTRSSADGRFVGQGGDSSAGGDSTIIDLLDDHLIGTPAFYDPGFFPDNSGFAFQAQNAYVCEQSVLTAVPAPTFVDYSEPECMTTQSIGLYQHLGAALGGGDYFTVDGQFTSDSGGHNATRRDPSAGFTSGSRLDFVPLVRSGATFMAKSAVSVNVPGEGDGVLSTSAGLVVTRVAGETFNAGTQQEYTSQNGFSLRKVIATPSGDSYTITAPEIGRYCFNGGKPGFSFDERWMAIHHYVGDADAVELGFTGPDDPAFAPYRTMGAANVYLVDITTGDKIRVTHMAPGQYALFPHFRSDGWMYFDVRQVGGGNSEFIAASDALLLVTGVD